MIKFINWFISPLRYVCVSKVWLDDLHDCRDAVNEENYKLREKLIRLNQSPCGDFILIAPYIFNFSDEKPEYKDNIV